MDFLEAKKIIAVMMASFPSYNPPDVEVAATVWASDLADVPYSDVSKALKAYKIRSTSGYAPTVGQLMEYITRDDSESEMEAWATVRKAIGRGGYYYEEDFKKLSPAAQKAVGSAGQLHIWAMDEDYNEGVVMSQFLAAYRTEVKRQKIDRAMGIGGSNDAGRIESGN